MPRGGSRGCIVRDEHLETRNNFAEDTTQNARVKALVNQLRMMERNNKRLLNLMEKQMSRSHEDDEGKFYKRLSSHECPKYDGEPDLVRFEDWIVEMEKLLEAINCPSRLKVKLATFYLTGTTELWWRSVKQTAIDSTWEQFMTKLRDQLYPPSLQRKKENEFFFLRQGTMLVIEYASKFRELARFATEIVISDQGKAIRFFEGLNLRIQKGTPRYQDVDDLYIQALEYERILEKQDGFNKRKNESSRGCRYN